MFYFVVTLVLVVWYSGLLVWGDGYCCVCGLAVRFDLIGSWWFWHIGLVVCFVVRFVVFGWVWLFGLLFMFISFR